ncbi:SDR family NAD(P)-dependent oxidoreductase [Chitinophaga silvatica]|uniref:SDR family NAD(P)-dependent oxidoreductase n=1 Tax=Chitinophaga silvatica TaxID=2282649 RepID=A0A3E1Y5K6_9BACT|nr:SDR family oxidoreductase [Chitinophaga silvatica]RFS20019.1 SDR family NAD(P)-dependent oxidoreductase [Chitinophaga silvatica]
MILVTGATGHLGKATITSLIQRGVLAKDIAALVRDEAKAISLKEAGIQLRKGDYTDYNSLKAAFKGIEQLLLISSSDVVGDRLEQHKNAINAAIENEVKRITYTGVDIRDFETTLMPAVTDVHIQTTNYLKEKGIPYTVLNNTLYADLIPLFAGEHAIEKGVFFPAGYGKVPFVPRAEMAEAAAVVLTTSGHENKEYAISAKTAYSFGEIAEILTDLSGKEVKYHAPDVNTYISQLVKSGVQEGSARFLSVFGKAIDNNEFDTKRSDLEVLLGRESVDLKDYLKTVYAK